MPTWLVTGGAGFIGGNFVLQAAANGVRIVNLDALTREDVASWQPGRLGHFCPG